MEILTPLHLSEKRARTAIILGCVYVDPVPIIDVVNGNTGRRELGPLHLTIFDDPDTDDHNRFHDWLPTIGIVGVPRDVMKHGVPRYTPAIIRKLQEISPYFHLDENEFYDVARRMILVLHTIAGKSDNATLRKVLTRGYGDRNEIT
jgi:hypothetical protein